MLLDANVLLYSIDSTSRHRWMNEALTAHKRVALPWVSLGAFLRISTHPRVFSEPLTSEEAWSWIDAWLNSPVTWIPAPGDRTLEILGQLVKRHQVTANLVPDAQLAALAIEHGIPVVTYDTDFERFPEVDIVRPS